MPYPLTISAIFLDRFYAPNPWWPSDRRILTDIGKTPSHEIWHHGIISSPISTKLRSSLHEISVYIMAISFDF